MYIYMYNIYLLMLRGKTSRSFELKSSSVKCVEIDPTYIYIKRI